MGARVPRPGPAERGDPRRPTIVGGHPSPSAGGKERGEHAGGQRAAPEEAKAPPAAASAVEPSPRPARWKRFVPRPLRRGFTLMVLIFVIVYIVVPELLDARKSVHLLGSVNKLYATAGVLLEVAALLAYSRLTRVVLAARQVPYLTLLRINMSSLAVSHVLPGGTAPGTGLAYRLLTEQGVSGPDTGFALATQGLGSALVLNVLLWLALLISIPLTGFNPLYGTAALVGVVLLAGFGVLVYLLTRGQDRAEVVLRSIARRIRVVDEATVSRVVHRLADRLSELGTDRSLLVRAGGWAAANWLLDAASLWVFVAAFGHVISPVSLLVCYGLANVLAAIPLTPGGLGVVEGVLTSTLFGFGTPRNVALLAVLSYRLINFWLPIPAGGISFLSLRVEMDLPRRGREHEIGASADSSGKVAGPVGPVPAGTADPAHGSAEGAEHGDVAGSAHLSGEPPARRHWALRAALRSLPGRDPDDNGQVLSS